MEYIFTFKNTNLAIKAEQCLLGRKLSVTVMPLPSQIRAGCGICLRISREDALPARQMLSDEGIDGMEIFSKATKDCKVVYTGVTL